MTQAVNTQPRTKNKVRKFFIYFLLFLAILLTSAYFICGITYSEGTRSGVLTKVSKKGFIFKTYEGEMNIGGISQGDGTIMPTTIFRFSITDDDIYRKLEASQGTRVVLYYKEVIKNLFWQGDTNYFITDVKPASSK